MAKDTIGRTIEIGDEIIFSGSQSDNRLWFGIVTGFCNLFGNEAVTYNCSTYGRSRKVKASNTYITKKAEVK